jgi:hypothetical protein
MKQILENWDRFVTEAKEEAAIVDTAEFEAAPSSNVLDLSKKIDGGFCKWNKKINQYAQANPEQLAEVLIFVVASQLMKWYDVASRFPLLMSFVVKKDGLIDDSLMITVDKIDKDGNHVQEEVPKFPDGFKQLVMGKSKRVQKIWENRQKFYSTMKPIIDRFNKEQGESKEEAVFHLYLALLMVPGLGLPKAAFATQLIIGRLGCIDAINLELYKGYELAAELTTRGGGGKMGGKKGEKVTFKRVEPNKKTGKIEEKSAAWKRVKKYMEFIELIAETNKADDASQFLWDSWVSIVAARMNNKGSIYVKMPNGDKIRVSNPYTHRATGDDPASKFRSKYVGKITPNDVSRQHFPPEMHEGKKKNK